VQATVIWTGGGRPRRRWKSSAWRTFVPLLAPRAWDLATRILQPWVQATREIGHPELTQVMEHAFEEAEREYRRALGQVERLGQNVTR
jgi:hypothetical protein